MAEDNTPTVTARKRKPSGHQRLRLELAKNAQTPISKVVNKKQKLATGIIQPREPRVKKNLLQKPDKPKAKFRKRQIHKAWLPTHMFHAKRAHMTPPKEPLWRMAIPLSPTQKGYRPTHRASTLRGAIAWDMSYMSTISLEGPEQSICGVLKALGVGKDDGEQFWSKRTAKWLKGTRSWQGWLYVRNGWPTQSIAPGVIIWCPRPQENGSSTEDSGKMNDTQLKRQVFIRVHPSAFLQLWQELLRLSKIQKPGVVVSDLRFEIGSIELVGPASAEALAGALSLHHAHKQEGNEPSGIEKVWDVLRNVTSPSNLPADAVLALNIADPRLRHPAKTQGPEASAEAQNCLVDVLAAWPVDKGRHPSTLFSRTARWTAQRSMPSQKAINRRKALADPGQYPDPKPTDPTIPIIVLPSRGQNGAQGSWTILMPWKCVLPVWYSLLYYPLSTEGTIRFGGLDQKRQIAFEHGVPWFPGDYPGTDAGDEWATRENARRKKDWEKRPKGRRVEYDSVKLGNTSTGSKGEIGGGWACDWSRLVKLPQKDSDGDTGMGIETKMHRVPLQLAKSVLATRKTNTASATAATAIIQPGGLITVNVTLLQRGVPAVCARIYRLPRSNPELLQQWLSLLEQTKGKKQQSKSTRLPRPASNAPNHEQQRYLAETLLLDKSDDTMQQAGDAIDPSVPDEEDLLGFVTTGNFNLAEGKGTGVGSILLERVLHDGGANANLGADKHLCIVRESGQTLGRLARWELV